MPRFIEILDDPWYRCLVRLQSLVTAETASFWQHNGVHALHLPITTSSVSSPMGLGSDSLPVRVDLFGVPTFLADSMQFMLEYGCRLTERGCYYLMPSFRGELADETHLNQFFHSEAEIPGGLDDTVRVADEYLRHLTASVLASLADEVSAVAGGVTHLEHLLATPTARLTFAEAADLLSGEPDAVVSTQHYRTLTRAGERHLIERLGPAVWVTHYDPLAVPFYQRCDPATGQACNADLLLGPGEVIGAGERHTSAADVRAALRRHAVAADDYTWYVEMKAHRPLRTSGFGMGVERYLMWVLKCPDIRRLQLVERYNGQHRVP
ncbi:asparaginase [Solwaraspora sp. WMMD406]|uniref:amino acid--tRNA ligase-related protein n=1 Tax=Solwaraspora sp. WMMD406 TaxID=3016095 RepID=UPI002416BA37|nr:amino acid--tRNA ligase-related protein [Solwaraspora sp. WMMD406]MDG4765247.1 asparaginase [Solwaraspora sp. WMMD406]